jgi:hypothetical protein
MKTVPSKDGTKRNIGGSKGNRNGTQQGGVVTPRTQKITLNLPD